MEVSREIYGFGFLLFTDIVRSHNDKSRQCALPSKFDSAEKVIAATWNTIITENKDKSLKISGFLNGKENQTILFNCGKIKKVQFNEVELCVIDENGNLKVFTTKNLDENDCKVPVCDHKWNDIGRIENSRQLYAINAKGELYKLDANLIPTWIPMLMKITKISCGFSHSILLAENGTVYTWGTGSRGQLGHGSLQDESKPKLVDILCGVTISFISAGGWHTVALADTGDIYTWGWNKSGQLGFPARNVESRANKTQHPEAVTMLNSPRLLELEKHLKSEEYVTIVDVSCGSRHTAVVTKDKKAVTWGWGKYGQLGQSCCCKDVKGSPSEPKKMKTDIALGCRSSKCDSNPHTPDFVEYFKSKGISVSSVICGRWNTFFNVLHDSS